MTERYLGPLVSGDEITPELRRRRRKDSISQKAKSDGNFRGDASAEAGSGGSA